MFIKGMIIERTGNEPKEIFANQEPGARPVNPTENEQSAFALKMSLECSQCDEKDICVNYKNDDQDRKNVSRDLGRFNHKVLEAINELSERLDSPMVYLFKYINPALLIPSICKALEIDVDEYSDCVWASTCWIVQKAKIKGGFARLYYEECAYKWGV